MFIPMEGLGRMPRFPSLEPPPTSSASGLTGLQLPLVGIHHPRSEATLRTIGHALRMPLPGAASKAEHFNGERSWMALFSTRKAQSDGQSVCFFGLLSSGETFRCSW